MKDKKSGLEKITHYYKTMKQYHLCTYNYWKICVKRGIPFEN